MNRTGRLAFQLHPVLLAGFAAGLAIVAAPGATLAEGRYDDLQSIDGRVVTGGAGSPSPFVVADDAAPPSDRQIEIAPNNPSPPPLGAAPPTSDRVTQENMFWDSVQKSNTLADYKAYLEAFPNGTYAPLARIRIAAMSPTPDAGQNPPPNQPPPGAPQAEAPQQQQPDITSNPPQGGGPPGGAQPPSSGEVGTPETEQALNLNRMDAMVVQQRLAALGFYGGPIDGDLGPGSRAAIAQWQQSHGLAPTGQLGPQQIATLRSESAPVNGQRVDAQHGCPPGFHLGPYGHRCWVNR